MTAPPPTAEHAARLAELFKPDALERLTRANADYYNSHGHYVPQLASYALVLLSALADSQAAPHLGCATTAELLTELQARAEVGGYAGYRTVDGHDYNESERALRAERIERDLVDAREALARRDEKLRDIATRQWHDEGGRIAAAIARDALVSLGEREGAPE